MASVASGPVGIDLVASVNVGLDPLGLLALGFVFGRPVAGSRKTELHHRDSYGHD